MNLKCALIVAATILLAGCRQSHGPDKPVVTDSGSSGITPKVRSTVADVIPKFEDITAKAGIQFVHQNSKTPNKYLLETMGAGCAFIDYDSDGWQDIILLNGSLIPGGKVKGRPTLALYHNNKNSTFTDVTKGSGLDAQTMYAMGVAVGDYDNDGKADIYISCVLGPGRLFHNEGAGKFKDVTATAGVANAGMFGSSCTWVDYDRDGKLDLFICNYVKYPQLKDDLPCFAGDRSTRIYCFPLAYDTSHCTLYHNDGNGKFTDVSVKSGIASAQGKSLGVSIWDYDGDGWPDIFVANDTVPGFLFHNEKNGTFTEVGVEAGIAYSESGTAHSGMGIDAADPHNNGNTTLVITNYYGQQTSYYTQSQVDLFREDRQSSGLGAATGDVLGFGILFFDFDNDGLQDVVEVNGHIQDDIQKREPNTFFAERTLIFHNHGDGTFTEVSPQAGKPFSDKIVGRGIAWGDFNNDGQLGLLVSENNGPARLWKNVTGTKNHWVGFHLVGTKSNRDGIGAMVTVKAGGAAHRAMVRGGSSYLSQSDIRPHFGLGDQNTADLEIMWPSGTVTKIAGVAADHIYTIREGASKVEP
ncbi:MAG: CRTAC1 family protein [Chthonomonadales bacterium]